MQCDDDPLSQFACDNGKNHWEEGGAAKGWDNTLLQLGTDVKDSGSNGFFGREKCDGGAGGAGHLSDIRLENAQSCRSSIDSRSVGVEGSSGGTNTEESSSFDKSGAASSSSSVFVPFGDYALGQQTKPHSVQQNVDDQVMN